MGIGEVVPGGGGRRAVFLDRDGVLNRAVVREGKPYPPQTLAEVIVEPGTAEHLRELKALGFLLIVVTNQPDVASGKQEKAVVEAINAHLATMMPLDDIYVCYHGKSDGCNCRKPRPGMMLEAAERHGIDLGSSYIIGDRFRDVEAGQAAGCRTVWIDYGYLEPGPAQPADARVGSLAEGAAWIVGRERGDCL